MGAYQSCGRGGCPTFSTRAGLIKEVVSLPYKSPKPRQREKAEVLTVAVFTKASSLHEETGNKNVLGCSEDLPGHWGYSPMG
jgi:hypothetical protein